MNLKDFMAIEGLKYIVISKEAHIAHPVAFELASEPGTFKYNGVEYVAINVDPIALPELVAYILENAGIEYEFTQGNGLVSLLTHTQVLGLIANGEVPDES